MTREIFIPISLGELIDKIAILELKYENIRDNNKLSNIRRELDLLTSVFGALAIRDDRLDSLRKELKEINFKLWRIEDEIRVKERLKQYDQFFIDLARSVYITNDLRADCKRRINQLFGSALVEEKSYSAY